MKKKCKVCGANAESEYCFQHKPRKPLSSTAKIIHKLHREYNQKVSNLEKRNELFMSIWNNRKHYSEISGTYLGKELSSAYFHHILPKEKYPQGEFDEENIVLLTLDEHTNIENDMYKYDVVNKKRELLLTKYNLK